MMRAILFVILLLATVGCTTRQHNRLGSGGELPRAGGNLSSSAWSGLDQARESKEIEQSWSNEVKWPLPFILDYQRLLLRGAKDAGEGEPDHGELTTLKYNDVFPPLVTLPLRVYWRSDEYNEVSEQPFAHQTVVYTPLYAWSWREGDGQLPYNVHLRGVPLIYARVKASAQAYERIDEDAKREGRLDVEAHQVLWTLGPFLAKARSSDEDDDRLNGYVATPLFLGGLPGLLVWTDFHVEISEREETVERGQMTYITTHGPLFGIPGYLSFGTEGGDGIRLVALGSLWTEVKTEESSFRGPLWGMFGWGKKDERNKVMIFWIPVRL